MKKILILGVLLLSLVPSVTHASISRINIFNMIEIYFWESFTGTVDIIEKQVVIDETKDFTFEYENKEELIIGNVDLANDEFLFSLPFGTKTMFSEYYLYINGFQVSKNTEKKFKKEKYYSDASQSVYSIKKKYIQNALHLGFNSIYFKWRKSGINSTKYSYFYGPLVIYDNYYRQVVCAGKIDGYILKNAENDTIKKTFDLTYKKITITRDSRSRLLKSWYYDAKVFCSSEDKELYYIYNIGYNYKQYSNRNYWVSDLGDYYSEKQYFEILKKYK